jgi:hypothetical protein
MFHRLRLANVENTRYGKVIETPSPAQLKFLEQKMKTGLEEVNSRLPPHLQSEDNCVIRLLKDGNRIYAWITPGVPATHADMAEALDIDANLARDASGIKISDFPKFGYDIYRLFAGTVRDWAG